LKIGLLAMSVKLCRQQPPQGIAVGVRGLYTPWRYAGKLLAQSLRGHFPLNYFLIQPDSQRLQSLHGLR
jgi:hypothetical protein